MKHRRSTRLRVLVAVLAAAATAACADDPAPPDPGPVVRPVRIVTVGDQAVAQLSFPGTVRATDRAELSFRVSGDLVQLPINEGDFINSGQLVGQLDTRDFEINVQEATAVFNQAQAERDRYQRLYESEAVPLADLELRIAQRDVAAARLEQARTNLGYTTLRAPFAGWVGRRHKENFERVAAQEPIITLHDVRTLEVAIDVPELLIARLEDPSRVELVATFAAAREREYPLSIKEIAAEADPATRTYQVVFNLRRPQGINLLPGMTANVIGRPAPDEPSRQLTIPAQAVFSDASGAAHVWLFDPSTSTVRSHPVTVGEVTGQAAIEVLDGLSIGDRIATTAVNALEDGMQVRPLTDGAR